MFFWNTDIIIIPIIFQPAPAPYDHTVDEQEHTVEQWKGKKLCVSNKMLF